MYHNYTKLRHHLIATFRNDDIINLKIKMTGYYKLKNKNDGIFYILKNKNDGIL